MILTGGNLGRSGILTGGRLSRAAVAAAGAPSYTLGVASFAGSTTRTDFTGWLGYKFTVASGATIHSLGRRKLSGNSAAHLVFLWDAASGLFVASGRADLSTGAAGSDVLDPLASDLALPAGSYFLFAQEASGGDAWYDGASATMAAGVTLDALAYNAAGYTLRDDFTGRVGFKFTPSSAQTVTHLGRYKVAPAATSSHAVYLMDAGGATLGSATVNLSGQRTGMVYAALGTPVALTGGSAYYVMSQETAGTGDLWFDELPASLAPGFTLNASAYHDGSAHDFTAGRAWPVGFKFGSGQEGLSGLTNGNTAETAGQAFGFPQFEFY